MDCLYWPAWQLNLFANLAMIAVNLVSLTVALLAVKPVKILVGRRFPPTGARISGGITFVLIYVLMMYWSLGLLNYPFACLYLSP